MAYSHDKFISLTRDRKNLWNDPAMQYKNMFVPDCLYKYWSFSSPNIDKNLSSLIDGKIWMPIASTLNDPFEFQMLTDELSDTERYKFRFDILGRNSVLSLADSSMNYLMWSHYGNGHTGLCLEFAIEDKDKIYPVTYIDSQIDITEDIRKWFEVKETILKKEIVDLSADEYEAMEKINRIMLYKHSIWKYENEFRITRRNLDSMEDNDARIGKGYIAELSDLGLRLKRVILGFNCDVMDKAKIIKYVNQKNHELLLDELIEFDYKYSVDVVKKQIEERGEFVEIAQLKRRGNELTLEIIGLDHKNFEYCM